MRKWSARLALLILLLLVAWIAFSADSTWSIVAQWILAGVVTIVLALWLWSELKPAGKDIHDHVQAFSAIFTILAVFIAAGIYFLEGRDKIRLSFALEASVVRLNTEGPRSQVLLTIRVPVENRGQRSVEIRCMGIDVQHPGVANAALRRSDQAREEMQLVRLQAEPIAYETPNLRECIEHTARRHHSSVSNVRPLFMWPMLNLRPGEVDDVHFEIPVSCTHPFVRVLLKIRVEPGDAEGYETKTIVPLRDICRGDVDNREGISAPALGTSDQAPSPTTPDESAPAQ